MNSELDVLMNELYVENFNEVETKKLICNDNDIVNSFGMWLCYLVAWGLHLPEHPSLDSHVEHFKNYNIERLRLE